MIKVMVVGKRNCLVRMTENTMEGFRQTGCEVTGFAVNGDHLLQKLFLKWHRAWSGDIDARIAERLAQRIKQTQPDLVVFVLGAWQPELVYQAAEAASQHAVRAAWIGDVFNTADSVFAKYMHWNFCTDSHFMTQLQIMDAKGGASYLPLAMDPLHFYPRNIERAAEVVYVAKNSPGRAAFVSQIQRPLSLYGRKWKSLKAPQHKIYLRDVSFLELPALYAGSSAVLNLKNEQNVVCGVNQRSFEPYGCKTPVLNDDVADLSRCFEVGKEILVYRSLDEFYALYDQLMLEPAFGRKVGEAGYRRVMAEHSYAHRARTMLQQLGLEPV